MAAAEMTQGLAQFHLEKVLASPGFARNERLQKFLRFVVERNLSGRADEIKESVLAVEVFGRSANYDPKQDSIVRTEAARLRARLGEYYLGEGKTDQWMIELPKGGYVPLFRPAPSLGNAQPLPRREPGLQARPADTRNWWIAAGAVFAIVAVAAVGVWRMHPQSAPIPIAVLPLVNLSQDPANDYFADGLTGELIHDLSIIDGLVVRSQTSSFVFKNKPQKLQEAGRQLNAEYLLEGSVLHDGKQLRVNAQLVRVRDDFPVWSGHYDRDLTDVFAIQDEISRGIVNSLRLKLGSGRRRYETSPKAYDLYLRGRALEVQLGPLGPNQSAQLYEQAIVEDPSFAPAYAALAAAYAYRTGEGRREPWAVLSREQEVSRMHVVVEKAMQLDPLLAAAHSALGTVQARDGQWAEAEKSFRHALELEPNNAVTRKEFILSILWPLGRAKDAIEQITAAEKLDPLSPDIQMLFSDVLFVAGRYPEAAKHCGSPCPRAMILEGKAAELIPMLEQQARDPVPPRTTMRQLAVAYASVGRALDAKRIADPANPEVQLNVFTALGDKNAAFETLQRMVPLGPVRIGRMLEKPEFASLRGDPRWKALRAQVGLPR
jgi:TolB-like protein